MSKPGLTLIIDLNGYHVNPDLARVKLVLAHIQRTKGNCPCVPNTTWSEDTMCPCLMYRSGQGCHCGLYVEDELKEA